MGTKASSPRFAGMHGTAPETLLMRADMAIRESRALQAQSNAQVGLGLTLWRRAQMNATFQAGLSPAQAIALLVLQTQGDDAPKAPAERPSAHLRR
jgi:hypothetical protein